MVFSPVHPFRLFRRSITCKALAVKIPDKIFRARTTEVTAGIDIDNQDPFLQIRFAGNRQLDEVRAFKLVRLHTVAFAEATHIRPLLQVQRRIETHLFIGRNHHHPLLVRRIPEDLRVAKIPQTIERNNNGILLILRKRTPIIRTVSQALDLSVAVAGRSIESNDGIRSEAGRIQAIDHGTTREDMSHRITGKGNRLRLPVQKVAADRMPPMHITPERAVRIMLIIKMIFPVLIDQAVRVVHPAVSRCMVIERTEGFAIRGIKRIGQLQFLPAKAARRNTPHLNCRLTSLRKTKRNKIIDFRTGKADIHIHIRRTAGIEPHLSLCCPFFDRQQQILQWLLDPDSSQCIS